jgi:hypothetical protein
MIDPTMFQLLSNGGFAALFVWLLWRTDARNEAREKILLETLPKIVTSLEEMKSDIRDLKDSKK